MRNAKENSLHHPDGARHPDAGADAGIGRWIVPRLAWLLTQVFRPSVSAARFVSGTSFSLPASTIDPSKDRRRGESDFTRFARLGEVYLPAPAGSGLRRQHFRDADRPRGTFPPSPPRRIIAPAAPISARSDPPPQVEFGFEMNVKRIAKPRVLQNRSPDEIWARLDRPASRRRWPI